VVAALLSIHSVDAEFNFEVGNRIHERVSVFMKTPTNILFQIARYRDNQGFSHDMHAPDRDAFFRFNDALMETYPEFQTIYYGLEDGMFAGHGFNNKIANYREPGHSGYSIDSNGIAEGDMQKHYTSCVNATSGGPLPCNLAVGGKYTECVNDCDIETCADQDSQRDCATMGNLERAACEANIKWCTSYTIKEATDDMRRGYLVRSTYCINSEGIPSQAPGEIAKKGTDELGSCYFSDGVTLVDRKIEGDYAVCGGGVCNNTFEGAYISRDYDPRWREWYITTKALQKPNWSPPYPFFSSQEIGITFSLPIYNMLDDGRDVFDGVLAVDYTFTDLSNFLRTNYQNSSTVVAIFEQEAPHYIVATSTGSTGVKLVLKNDEEVPCPDPSSSDCKAARVPAAELAENEMDTVIRNAFLRQQAEQFPQARLISSRSDNVDTLFASQVKSFSIFDQSSKLEWQIMITTPVETEDADTIVVGDSLFGVLIATASLGVVVCAVLVGLLIKNRAERPVITSDWRFLGAFVVSCSLLNLSCFAFLGPNTDELCLLRMWLVHFFFVLALSLLFVKTYRMYTLVGSNTFRRVTMSHARTARLAIPFVLLQTLILLIFTFVDPSKSTELIESSGSDITHRLICSHKTPAFFIVMIVYEGGLILVGCVLAFKTRNLESEFNESKEIILSMYDTAVISTILLVVANAAVVYQGQKRLLFSLGIFWTSCFASCMFVLPRMMKVQKQRSPPSTGRYAMTAGISEAAQREHDASASSRMAPVRESSTENGENEQTENP